MTIDQAKAMMLAAYQAEVEYRGRTFEPDNLTISNIEKVAMYLTDPKTKFGIMLSGKCGNGKTTMLHAFQSAMNYLSRTKFFDDKGIRIIDAKDIISYAKDTKRYDPMRSSEMLGIEDMGREPTEIMDYGNILNPVIDLLEYRYSNQLFTVITTNLTPKEVREKYGDRIADRFNEMLCNIVFENNTYRH
jgi:DNA replication protein DnaC